jgi:Uma2 family endonuclease
MPATLKKARTFETVADLVKHLGGIPPERILMWPTPGTAKEKDAIALADGDHKRLCELIDGILVEKTAGLRESLLAAYLIEILGPFVRARNLGLVLAPDGLVRLFRGQIRIPDVSFISWESLPDDGVPKTAIAEIAPDLVIEILSRKNTKAEMVRKRRDYFRAGGKLFWEVDPRKRSVRVYTGPDAMTELTEADTLGGGKVLPGFRLALRDLFAELDRRK